MAATITATYTPENDDWTVTVSGPDETLTGKAPGIIAARDRADQLVEKLAAGGKATVVHLLNGSALEFTHAYMSARLTRADDEEPAKSELQEAIDDPATGVFADLGEAIDDETPAKGAETTGTTGNTDTTGAAETAEAKPVAQA